MTRRLSSRENDSHVIRFTFLAFALGTAMSAGAITAYTADRAFLWLAPTVGAIFAALVFGRRMAQHDYINELRHNPQSDVKVVEVVKEVFRDMPRGMIVLGDDVAVWQPKAGAFAELVRGAVDNSSRAGFSVRRARELGYTSEQYALLVAQLKYIGWLADEMSNGAPVVNSSARDRITDWLSVREMR